ncbi:nuclear transport factor 2 family protein [Zooshikella sp. RANM57]|uniref:nuclear transport factor 2 family protein n=1 Tax=Zooshikella sp. RANM57 TaxID=3425863 RepID=UPI003D6E68D6
MTESADELSSFVDMLKQALGDKIDQSADGFIAMMAKDFVMEFPYAPEDGVKEIKGQDALANYLANLQDLIVLDRITVPKVYRAQNSDVVILEFECRGHAKKTGRPYNQRYISVITLREGKILRYVDYWNPLNVFDAIGSLASLKPAEENKE